MPWDGLIDDSITSDEVEHGRPEPDMIFELCRRANVSPEETIKVGDTPADILQGRAAGVGLVVATTYGTHTKEQLEKHNPDLFIDQIGDLLNLF